MQSSRIVVVVNIFFMLLALFHLAYLGVMFGGNNKADETLQIKVCLVLVQGFFVAV